MSDAPREEEIYQALAPGGTYKSGLVNPVAAQQETTVSIPMRFKGAMGGGAVGNDDYPDHEPRASVPYKHYKDLEDVDPKLHEAVTHVADEIHIPRTDLASLVYANSDYNPNARNGARTGYMGLTPDDARQLDPEGHLDINDPIDNLFMGAMKYKRISNRFGMGTPNAFAAYHGGGDRVHNLLEQDPDEHRRMAPDGTFDFLNKVLGRGRDGEGSGSSGPAPDDSGDGGDGTPEARSSASVRGPQSYPDSWAPMSRARNMEPDREAALMRPAGPVAPPPDDTGLAAATAPPAGPSSSYGGDDAGWQRPAPPRPPPATDVRAATAGVERAIGAQRGQPPVPPPPSGERMIPGVGNPNQVDIQRALTDPAYRESIMPTTSGPGAPYAPPPTRLPAEQQPGQVFNVSGGGDAVAAVRQAIQGSPQEEAVARGVPVEQVMRERAARVPAPPPARDLEGQRAQAYTGELPPPPPPSAQPPGDTDWQRPIPPAPPGPPVDDTNWQRPMPLPELSGQGGALQPAPREPVTPENPNPRPAAPPTTSGGYGVGGAIGSGVRQYADQQADQPAAQPEATTGSGAPPAPPRGPAPGQAIGTDNMAAQLNQQELARVQGGRPDVAPTGPTQAPVQAAAPAGTPKAGGPAATTGSGGPAPTTAPGAGGDTGAPANLPAGAPKALAPPGSAPTPTSAPPIDRLSGNGGTMTPASAVRAGAQGPGGVLTHIARNGPRGMSMGEGWDHFQDLLERAMIMKGDIAGLQHAQEYVFRMKHKGAMENMMQAIASMDDPETAVRFLAKSHAFVTDGTAIGFQVLNGQIYGQKYDEQTHDKIGNPFQVTEGGLRKLALAYSPPDKFNAALNQERTTNETGRHNRKTETHADEQLKQQEMQSQRNLQEKQLEYQSTQARLAEQAAQRAHEHAATMQQRQDLADQQERVRKETQAAQHAQQTAEKEKERISREDQNEKNRQLREDQAAQRAAENADKAAARAAEEKAGHETYANNATDEYFGRGGMVGIATDHNNQPYKGPELTKARTIFSGMLHHDKTISGGPEAALDYTRGFLSGKYKMAESVGDDGKRYANIRDEEGNVLATVPSSIWRMYLPKQGTVPGGAKAK